VGPLLRLTLALALLLGLGSCATAPETGTDCAKRRSCVRYIAKIQKRVYREWNPDRSVQSGTVTMTFKIDSDGRFQDIRVVRSDSEPLAASCKEAMLVAGKAPPIPEGLEFLLNKKLLATFAFERRD
jgi:TonB family protein